MSSLTANNSSGTGFRTVLKNMDLLRIWPVRTISHAAVSINQFLQHLRNIIAFNAESTPHGMLSQIGTQHLAACGAG